MHMVRIHMRHRAFCGNSSSCAAFFITAVSAVTIMFLLTLPAGAAPDTTSHLQEGIRLYNSGRYNEALSEFNDQIETDPQCPLAYYYAARIRIAREQFARAEKNLSAAFRDSTEFHDAQALMAVVYLNIGREKDALAAWKQFVAVEGRIDEGTAVRIDDIMFPEEYRALAEQKRIEREKKEQERLEAERREKERLAEEERARAKKKEEEVRQAIEARRVRETGAAETPEGAETEGIPPADTSEQQTAAVAEAQQEGAAGPATAETPAETLSEDEIAAPLEDLEQRIRSTIRTGFLGLAGILVALASGVAGTLYVIRKRRLTSEETNFTDEVERLMIDREFELSEEQAILELEARKRGIINEAQNIMKPVFRPGIIDEPQSPPVEEAPPEIPEKPDVSEFTREAYITEEVKGLVSRLYREGKLPEEIANIADLTKTEVDLILAVRERHISDLIADIHADDDVLGRDELLQAIQSLSFEGAGTREIAKRLNISLSEVELASSILELKKQASA